MAPHFPKSKHLELIRFPAIESYLDRIGATMVTMLSAAVYQNEGRYGRRLATIRFSREGTVDAPDEYAPTEKEAAEIKEIISTTTLPEPITMLRRPELPKELKDVDPDSLYDFVDERGEFVMMEQRLQLENGDKAVIPWTYFSDKEWRRMQPEGLLPLWGLDQLKNAGVVMIHEGAKAARHCRWMQEGGTLEAREALAAHPWKDWVQLATHVGWTGGALSPERTDWNVLNGRGIGRAYIVSDNDPEGVSAVRRIAKQLRVPTYHVCFTQQWPACFDLGDPFPARLFRAVDGQKVYTGPDFLECVHPATWATDVYVGEDGKKRTKLRPHFVDEWLYIEELDQWVHRDSSTLRPDKLLNKMLRPFSDTNDTVALLQQQYHGRIEAAAYLPGKPTGRQIHQGKPVYNLYRPPRIRPLDGDPTPFLEFMEHLFPNPDERYEVMKWVATLIARPEARMHFGMLLVSRAQGVGKTTLADSILAPLVGEENVSFPRERDVVDSSFNSWTVRKRLVVVAEIYAGHNRKAYNQLKDVTTDKKISVNEKYLRPYTLDNYVHVLASSNSMQALAIDPGDRRWLIPEVTEEQWGKDNFDRFYEWLGLGGLQTISRWAEDFGDYVQPGDRPATTKRKLEISVETRSEHLGFAADIARAMIASERKPIAVAIRDVVEWIKERAEGKLHDSQADLRWAMMNEGLLQTPERISAKGCNQYVLYNKALQDLIEAELRALPTGTPDKARDKLIGDLVRKELQHPRDLVEM